MTSTAIRFGTGATVHDVGFYREWLSVAGSARRAPVPCGTRSTTRSAQWP